MKAICTLLLSLCFTLPIDAQVVKYPSLFSGLSKDVAQRAQKRYKLLDSLERTNAPVLDKLRAQITTAEYYAHQDNLEPLSDSLLYLIFSNKRIKEQTLLYAKAITTRGIAEFKKGNFEKALQSQYEALSIREKENAPSISYNYHLIGLNLMARDKYNEGLKSYLKAAELTAHKKRPNPKLTQRIAHAYHKLNDIDKAKEYYNLSIAEAQEIKSSLVEGTSMSRLATVYASEGNYKKAVELLEASEIKREGKMYIGHKTGLYQALASNHLALGHTDIARINADKAYAIAKQMNSFGYQQGALRVLVDIDNQEGKKENAIKHYEALLSARDSFYIIENTNKFNELYTKLELGDKERELLKKEVIIQEESRTKNRLYMIIGLMGIMAIMGGLLIRNKIKHEKKITEQNVIIKKALAEKEVLLKEIHHRVKNNLQIVSSLLGMQSLSIKDESIKSAITESRARVHSMSLIHQNLYKKEKFSGIEMKPYINQLCSNLLNTYHYEEKEISLITNVADDLWLDVETVVPLGLIINELITNSLKHAFEDRSTGMITTNLNIRDKVLILNVKDNGIGINEEDNNEDSFGHSLIDSFKEKLEAGLLIENNGGTSVTLQIKSYSTV